MTLVAAWVQRHATLRQLVIASDSRITGGESWEACPKVVPLPRPGTVIAMSGDAVEAYAFLIQAINTCNLLDGNQSGRTDIGYLAKKLRDVYADIRRHVRDLPAGESVPSVPELNIVLCGWSWRNLRFEGYSYKFDVNGVLRMNRIGQLDEHRAYGVYFFGDADAEASKRLKVLQKQKGLPVPMTGDPRAREVARNAYLEWEPLEVLLDIIGDRGQTSVGGVPQIAYIYQRGESECFVWRDQAGNDHFGGRPVQPRERFDRRILKWAGDRVIVSFSDRGIALSQLDSASDGVGDYATE
ncbi:hypothetical protein IOD16_30990 [Saccharothrix sp. 6-C]|uniref:hypothetical protein n=1 Tax=Saccharothrix sp. 6-C TaxID=2781735 RepID=UPI001916F6C8|nr:hypothetical protein [Saccharothrix sp. 6-C]QQQ75479.1 hypothetical protein IOD16_30990 [Saccharothrix sp. 6-C]